MTTKEIEKIITSANDMSLFHKQILLDELLKDGRINYPFKDLHQKEIKELEERIKLRLADNVKDEFEAIISGLRIENGRLKDKLDRTNSLYEEHLKRMKKDLEIEKEKFMSSMMAAQTKVKKEHQDKLNQVEKQHREVLSKNEASFRQILHQKENEIEELMIRAMKQTQDSAKSYVAPLVFKKGQHFAVLSEEKITQIVHTVTESERQLIRNIVANPPSSSSVFQGDVEVTSITNEVRMILERHKNELLEEWLCETLIDEIGQIQMTLTYMNWNKRQKVELFTFNARKITSIFSSSLALYRFLMKDEL